MADLATHMNFGFHLLNIILLHWNRFYMMMRMGWLLSSLFLLDVHTSEGCWRFSSVAQSDVQEAKTVYLVKPK
ncbi:hypothetical protein GOBAR_AA33343 [Gossypium barbadense]|uniref:Uncharacterized protein n=1 Tax=Gossypium barbadense TaxID=3634 RepID=A0A2P5W8C0_GOSBA|nr:hypothetical protein GOBAR_AA33343 [Gossypium barbadense]